MFRFGIIGLALVQAHSESRGGWVVRQRIMVIGFASLGLMYSSIHRVSYRIDWRITLARCWPRVPLRHLRHRHARRASTALDLTRPPFRPSRSRCAAASCP
jgi:hypothetical protein